MRDRMRVIVFGASGKIGRAILAELVRRGHKVTAVSRAKRPPAEASSVVQWVRGDATDAASVARLVVGHDAAVSAIGPGADGPAATIARAASALPEGLRQAHLQRLIVVGGAGSLESSPGVSVLDSPDFPATFRSVAVAHREALATLRSDLELDWTVITPARDLSPGIRTGRYRTGGDHLLHDEQGRSRISIEDFAVALVDELETPRHLRRRFTVASV